MTSGGVLDVEGRAVRVSNLDRVLWPRSGVTKGDLVAYYAAVADVLLPHLRCRPVTLHRYPEGVEGPHFFQTRCPPGPPWVAAVELSYPRTGKTFDAAVLDDLPSLVWAANLATVEVHPFLGCVGALAEPTHLVLDLDPGPPAGLVEACRTALRSRALLADLGLRATPKTSGSKGLHVVVPLAPGASYPVTKAVARRLARALAADDPGGVVDRMARHLRPGRVFVDWSQNDPGKSTVAAYSPRRGGTVPGVSTPLAWAEVEDVAATGDPRPLAVTWAGLLDRLDALGDLSASALVRDQVLPAPAS